MLGLGFQGKTDWGTVLQLVHNPQLRRFIKSHKRTNSSDTSDKANLLQWGGAERNAKY